ncbi:MAG: N-acetylmuramoyl-L-alanine amidase [Chitinophagaceae bacterium]
MVILSFIAKLVISSGLLYGYYHLFLRNKRFHRYNRFYLLAITLLSFIIPFINIPVNLFGGAQQHPVLIKTLKVINGSGWEEPVVIYANRNAWINWVNLQNCLWALYILGVLAGAFMVMRSFIWIRNLRNKYTAEQVGTFTFYNTEEPGTPFSFFKDIFWHQDIPFNDWKGQQIFRHEAYHVKENHSADVLLMEIACSIAWFNPFFYIIRKEIRAIHEFLADEYAAAPDNRYAYAELLVQQAIAQKNIALVHPFFHTQIKRRILMITQSNLIRRSGYISRIMVLPLLFLLVSAFAVKINNKLNIVNVTKQKATKTITAVIDAGHGGIYAGAHVTNNIIEKDITLAIAQKIKALSPGYNVNVILTRKQDELVGGASTLKEDLDNRVAITNNANADLFVSIHVNAAIQVYNTEKTGFEAYLTTRRTDSKSKLLSSAILSQIKDIYPVDETIKLRDVGIMVLEKTNIPATLIECGYLTNPKDAAFIRDPANQEKVARKILEGIVQFSNASSASNPANVETETVSKEAEQKTIASANAVDTVPGSKNILTKVEIEADYPGGQSAWIKYLIANIKYPKAALDKEIKGTVVVQFIVDEKGGVSDVKAINGPELLKAESIRIIKESGKWVSAMQNGKKVKSYKRQPITYMLEPAKTS